jgi:hypothetical protein
MKIIQSENEIRLKSIQHDHDSAVALLEQRHAAVVASMRSELDVALERAAKAEQLQHVQDIQLQRSQSSSATADSSVSAELQLLRFQLAQFQEQLTHLQQETRQAVSAREEAELQMQKASDMVVAVQHSRDESLLKEKEALLQVRSVSSSECWF